MFQRSGGYCADDVATWQPSRTVASVPANQHPTLGNYHTKFSYLDIPLSAGYVHTANQDSCHTRPNGLYQNGHGNSARQGNAAVGAESDGYEYKYWGGNYLWMSHDRPAGEWNNFPCNDVITVDTDSRLRAYKNPNYLEEFCNLIEWARPKKKILPQAGNNKVPRVHNGDAKHQFVITQSNGGPVVSYAFRVGDAGGGCDKKGLYYFASNPPLKGSKAGNFVSFACAAPQLLILHLQIALAIQYPRQFMLASLFPLSGMLFALLSFVMRWFGNTIMQGLKDGAYCAPNTLFNTQQAQGGLNGGKNGKWWDVSLNSRSWPVFQGLRMHRNNAWELGHNPTSAEGADAKLCGTSPTGLRSGGWIALWGIGTLSYLEEMWDNTCIKYGNKYGCSWRGCGWTYNVCKRRVGWRDNHDGMVPLHSCTVGYETHLIIIAANHQDGCGVAGDGFLWCGPICYMKRALREAKWKSNVRWCQFYGYSVVASHNFWLNTFPQGGPCPCSAHKNLPGFWGYKDGNAHQAVSSCQ